VRKVSTVFVRCDGYINGLDKFFMKRGEIAIYLDDIKVVEKPAIGMCSFSILITDITDSDAQ